MPMFKVSLSRAHKIVQRLDAELKTLTSSNLPALVHSFELDNVSQTAAVAQAVAKNRQERDALLARAERLLGDVLALRSQISHFNQALGINDLMARAHVQTRIEQLWGQATGGKSSRDLALGFPVAKLGELTESHFKSESRMYRTGQFTVETLVEGDLVQAEERKRAASIARNALMDQIADLNRNPVELTLSEDAARLCGLA